MHVWEPLDLLQNAAADSSFILAVLYCDGQHQDLEALEQHVARLHNHPDEMTSLNNYDFRQFGRLATPNDR